MILYVSVMFSIIGLNILLLIAYCLLIVFMPSIGFKIRDNINSILNKLDMYDLDEGMGWIQMFVLFNVSMVFWPFSIPLWAIAILCIVAKKKINERDS